MKIITTISSFIDGTDDEFKNAVKDLKARGCTKFILDLRDNGAMLVDGVVLGQWEDGHIITRSGSPLGEVIITYKKE